MVPLLPGPILALLLVGSLFSDFENYSVFKPAPQHEKTLNGLLDQLIAWSGALKKLRTK
ncbi:MAG: hypothetical protein WBV96_00260 [Polyangia bacterium]